MSQMRCRLCDKFSLSIFVVKTRLKTLAYIDTRAISLLSGTINMTWALCVLMPATMRGELPGGALAQVFYRVPVEWFVGPVFILGACEFWFAMLNHYKGRLYCSNISAGWWVFLTVMTALPPYNVPSLTVFACMAFFRGWTYFTLDNVHPEGKHFRAS